MSLRFLSITALLLATAACGGDGGDDGVTTPSSNASLSALIVEAGNLTPAFTSTTTAYTLDVRWSVMSTRVTATSASNRARVTVNGTAVPSGVASGPIALNVGDTPINIVVTAEDGTQRTYTVTISRAAAATDAGLADLSLTVGNLVQIFDPSHTSYDVAAGHLGASTRVVAELRDPLAAGIRVNGQPTSDGEPSAIVDLAVGTTTINVEVTAEDGVTTRTYIVSVNRALLGTISQRAYVKATNTDARDRFGMAIALFGHQLLVGAPFEQSSATGIGGDQTNNNSTDAGAAYVYERLGGVWTVSDYVKASNTDAGDLFGRAVDATTDRLIVGAPGEQSRDGTQADNSGSAVGAVYVFDAAGNPTQMAYLKASNPDDDDAFGGAVATSGDLILAGAEFEQSSAIGVGGDQADNSLTQAGAAYLFEVDGTGGWAPAAYLKASNTRSNARFGSATAVSGSTLVVGARGESSGTTGIDGDQGSTASPNSGAAYVFDQAEDGSWSQSAYIKASNTQTDDLFGAALALDGNRLAVGAPGEDSGDPADQTDNAQSDAGAVYLFVRGGAGIWSQEAYLKAPAPGFRDRFGTSVALVGNLLAVGAPGERSSATGIDGDDADESAVDSGAVYVFERDAGGSWNQVAYVKASNTDANDLFGRYLDLDGDTLVVGAPAEAGSATGVDGNQSNNDTSEAGAVYVVQ